MALTCEIPVDLDRPAAFDVAVRAADTAGRRIASFDLTYVVRVKVRGGLRPVLLWVTIRPTPHGSVIRVEWPGSELLGDGRRALERYAAAVRSSSRP